MTRKKKLQDLLLILKKFYGDEEGAKYVLENYSNVDQQEKIEEGIDIAVEMLYDKMNEGAFLNDIAQMIKNNFTAEDFLFDGAEIIVTNLDYDGSVLESTKCIVKALDDDNDEFDLIDTNGNASLLAFPAEDEYMIEDGKLYIDCVEGSLEIKLK